MNFFSDLEQGGRRKVPGYNFLTLRPLGDRTLSEVFLSLHRGSEWFESRAHLGLAAADIALGREKEARAEAAEVLRINPKFTLDDLAKRMPGKDQSAKDKFIGALRMAGLN